MQTSAAREPPRQTRRGPRDQLQRPKSRGFPRPSPRRGEAGAPPGTLPRRPASSSQIPEPPALPPASTGLAGVAGAGAPRGDTFPATRLDPARRAPGPAGLPTPRGPQRRVSGWEPRPPPSSLHLLLPPPPPPVPRPRAPAPASATPRPPRIYGGGVRAVRVRLSQDTCGRRRGRGLGTRASEEVGAAGGDGAYSRPAAAAAAGARVVARVGRPCVAGDAGRALGPQHCSCSALHVGPRWPRCPSPCKVPQGGVSLEAPPHPAI